MRVLHLLLVAWLLNGTFLTAQRPAIPMSAKQAVSEMVALAALHPEAKAFQSAAEGAYPVAWVDGRPTVGCIGQLNDEMTSAEWAAWADSHPTITPGTCRYGIASFRIDAFHLDLLDGLPMSRVELASKAVPDLELSGLAAGVHLLHLKQGQHTEVIQITKAR